MTATVSAEQKRAAAVAAIMHLLDDLNAAGAQPAWTRSRLHLYVYNRYSVTDRRNSLDALGFNELYEVRAVLQQELVALRQLGAAVSDVGAPPLALLLEEVAVER